MICESCGCTDEGACVDGRSGEPCHWVRPGLCSACVVPCHEKADRRLRSSYGRFKATFLGAWRRVHGDKAAAVLEEEGPGNMADLFMSLAPDHADATAVLHHGEEAAGKAG